MSVTIMDFRVHEEMAGAVLKEVAALEPAERLQEAQSLQQIMAQAVQGLEELWANLREPLQRGLSPSAVAALARILTRSANLVGSSWRLLVSESPSLEEFKEANMARLERIKARAASLRRLVELQAPAPDMQRLARSQEQMKKGEAVAVEDFLAELRE